MNNTWIAVAGGIITTVASSFVSWFFAKRKYNAEVDNHLISNMQQSLEFYKCLADDTKNRLEAVLKENEELRREIHELRTEQQMLISVLAKYGLQQLVENNTPEEQ